MSKTCKPAPAVLLYEREYSSTHGRPMKMLEMTWAKTNTIVVSYL